MEGEGEEVLGRLTFPLDDDALAVNRRHIV